MFALSEATKQIIERHTGITMLEFQELSHDEIHARIEQKIGRELKLKYLNANGFKARGNVYLNLGRKLTYKSNCWLKMIGETVSGFLFN